MLHQTFQFLLGSVRKRKINFQRIQALNCPTCVWLNWTSVMRNGTLCHAYDEEFELPYFMDPWHINALRAAKLYPYTKEVIDNTFKRLNLT